MLQLSDISNTRKEKSYTKIEAFQHDFCTSLIEFGAASKKTNIQNGCKSERKQAAEWKSFESASIVRWNGINRRNFEKGMNYNSVSKWKVTSFYSLSNDDIIWIELYTNFNWAYIIFYIIVYVYYVSYYWGIMIISIEKIFRQLDIIYFLTREPVLF